MRRRLQSALATLGQWRNTRGLRGSIDTVLKEVRDAYAALPPERGAHAASSCLTLADRITLLAGEVERERFTTQTVRAQMLGERQAVTDHDRAALAAGYPPHAPGTRRSGCPGCAAMPPAEELSVPADTMPAADDVPQAWVDALLDGLAVPGSGATTYDVSDFAARSGVAAVLRAYLSRGGGRDGG